MIKNIKRLRIKKNRNQILRLLKYTIMNSLISSIGTRTKQYLTMWGQWSSLEEREHFECFFKRITKIFTQNRLNWPMTWRTKWWAISQLNLSNSYILDMRQRSQKRISTKNSDLLLQSYSPYLCMNTCLQASTIEHQIKRCSKRNLTSQNSKSCKKLQILFRYSIIKIISDGEVFHAETSLSQKRNQKHV